MNFRSNKNIRLPRWKAVLIVAVFADLAFVLGNVPSFRVKVATSAGVFGVEALNRNTHARIIDGHVEDIHDVLVVA